MLTLALCAFTLVLPQGSAAPSLPNTPQGRHVAAYLEAFNDGDEKKFLAAQETLMEPAVLERRSVEERAKMFQRMKGDFGTLKVTKVVDSSPEKIVVLVPNKDGEEATFTFSFEKQKPHRISSISVEIDRD